MTLEALSTLHGWSTLITLNALEIVLAIDNVIFIVLLSQSLPASQQRLARNLGLFLGLVMRVILLLAIAWVIGLTSPLITAFEFSFSGRDLLMLGGGLFLLYQGTANIHELVYGEKKESLSQPKSTFGLVILQIVVIDFVFSLDSVITAIGITENILIIIIAMSISMLVMIFSSNMISQFVESHPTIKMLALSFILMIGTLLVAEGLHFHVPRGYIYFAMAFTTLVEILNIMVSKRKQSKLT